MQAASHLIHSLKISGLADLLNGNQPATKSQTSIAEISDYTAKINLLAENVQSLLDRNQTIDEEIKSVKSNVQSMTNQIQQINVSPTINHVCTKKFYRKT